MKKSIRFLLGCAIVIVLFLVPVYGTENVTIDRDFDVSFQASSVRLTPGDTYQLTPSPSYYSYIWYSDDTSVATVNTFTGLITAVEVGSTQIHAYYLTADNTRYVGDFWVYVDDTLDILSVILLEEGETYQFDENYSWYIQIMSLTYWDVPSDNSYNSFCAIAAIVLAHETVHLLGVPDVYYNSNHTSDCIMSRINLYHVKEFYFSMELGDIPPFCDSCRNTIESVINIKTFDGNIQSMMRGD